MFPGMPTGPRPPNRVAVALQTVHMLCDPSHHWGSKGPEEETETWKGPSHNSVNGRSLEGTEELRDDAINVLRQYIRGEIQDVEPDLPNYDVSDNIQDRLAYVEEVLEIDPPAPGETDVDVINEDGVEPLAPDQLQKMLGDDLPDDWNKNTPDGPYDG